MELTLTALIKAIILHWGRGSSSGDKQLETSRLFLISLAANSFI